MNLLELGQITFVTGKGGVGKSLVAAGLAYREAQAGKRVLLVEIGENSYYRDFWQLLEIRHEPISHHLGFDLALWSGETCLKEYVLHFLKMERLYSLFFENKVMRALIGVAPGLMEISILGKITSSARRVGPELKYDKIIVDCYATGHALALFRTPKGLMEAIRFGPMGQQSKDIYNILRDEKLTSFIIISLLEEMPVLESIELKKAIQSELGRNCELIVNRVMNLPIEPQELDSLAPNEQATGLSEFVLYLKSVFQRQQECRSALSKEFTSLREVPLVFSANPDELVKGVGEALRQI